MNLFLAYSFKSTLWNGHSGVIIFFVLSGFVLSLPFYTNVKFNYREYLTKRICRIYIPYIVVIIIVIVVKIMMYSKIGTIPGLTPWGLWNTKISFNLIIQHILFIGEYNSDAFLMVIWSLVHEMRISIIFPFIMFFLIKVDWKISIVLAMFLSFISSYFIGEFPSEFNTPISTNYFITLHYLAMFVIGALLAKHRDNLISQISNLKMKYFLLPIGIFLFSYPTVSYSAIFLLVGDVDFTLYFLIIDWIIAIGAILIILSSFSTYYFQSYY